MVLYPNRRLRPQAVTGPKHERHATAVKVGPDHANDSFGAKLRHIPNWPEVARRAEHESLVANSAGDVTTQLALRSGPRGSCCAVTAMPFRSRLPIMLQEHPDRLFDYVLFWNGYAARDPSSRATGTAG